MPQDTAVVATLFAPISFPPAPVLVFQDRPFGKENILITLITVLPASTSLV
jgi:hypothetical protein